MKNILILIGLIVIANTSFAQERKWANPIIQNYGRILDLEDVDLKPEPGLEYKILIEQVFDMNDGKQAQFAATNVARLINLHAIGGVKKEDLKVVVVIHAEATNSVVNNEVYKEKYNGNENPYISLYEELAQNGVELIVCGQSLAMYGHKKEDLLPHVKVATSALTAVTTYQLKGYAYFKWN